MSITGSLLGSSKLPFPSDNQLLTGDSASYFTFISQSQKGDVLGSAFGLFVLGELVNLPLPASVAQTTYTRAGVHVAASGRELVQLVLERNVPLDTTATSTSRFHIERYRLDGTSATRISTQALDWGVNMVNGATAVGNHYQPHALRECNATQDLARILVPGSRRLDGATSSGSFIDVLTWTGSSYSVQKTESVYPAPPFHDFGARWNASPCISPDGTWFTMVGKDGKGFTLNRFDIDASGSVTLRDSLRVAETASPVGLPIKASVDLSLVWVAAVFDMAGAMPRTMLHKFTLTPSGYQEVLAQRVSFTDRFVILSAVSPDGRFLVFDRGDWRPVNNSWFECYDGSGQTLSEATGYLPATKQTAADRYSAVQTGFSGDGRIFAASGWPPTATISLFQPKV